MRAEASGENDMFGPSRRAGGASGSEWLRHSGERNRSWNGTPSSLPGESRQGQQRVQDHRRVLADADGSGACRRRASRTFPSAVADRDCGGSLGSRPATAGWTYASAFGDSLAGEKEENQARRKMKEQVVFSDISRLLARSCRTTGCCAHPQFRVRGSENPLTRILPTSVLEISRSLL